MGGPRRRFSSAWGVATVLVVVSSFAPPPPQQQQQQHHQCHDAAPAFGGEEEASLRVVLASAGASDDEIRSVVKDNSQYAGAAKMAQWLVEYAGFTGSDVARMLATCRGLMTANRAEVSQSVSFLTESLGLKKGEARRVVRARPQLLLTQKQPAIFDTGACPAVLATTRSHDMRDTIDLLRHVGVREKHIKEMVMRWPQLLSIEMPQMLAVTDFLANDAGFAVDPPRAMARRASLASLYRQTPWLLAARVGDQLRPVVEFLVGECGVQNVDVVVRAYPRCLIVPPDDLRPRVEALRRYGVSDDDLGRLIESFPLVFGLDVSETMDPAVAYWTEIRISREDVARICRAFPSLLGVSVDDMKESVAFLREIGVSNVARFVTRIPPVLAYDVDAVLRPKMAFAVRHALSVFDVARFPAFFSYPLDTIIRPRAEFLAANVAPVSMASLGLSVVLTPTDDEFAKMVGASPGSYAAFKRSLLNTTQPTAKNQPAPTWVKRTATKTTATTLAAAAAAAAGTKRRPETSPQSSSSSSSYSGENDDDDDDDDDEEEAVC
ncbi:hypothetical protein CTAYLR_001169 [Chrysophaeum taylorii]|uniref:Uncharacterized protein n=1 Tax=Chrysophaeum taylorii TaxID=2483200 RepID=A0AAD7UPV7_9STRA|nr:hypothetical protein CTAYLR_001169 [Chrysophaeum taylorii]